MEVKLLISVTSHLSPSAWFLGKVLIKSPTLWSFGNKYGRSLMYITDVIVGGIFVIETLKYNVNGRQRSVIASLELEIYKCILGFARLVEICFCLVIRESK